MIFFYSIELIEIVPQLLSIQNSNNKVIITKRSLESSIALTTSSSTFNILLT